MGTERQHSLAAGLGPKMSPEVAAVQGQGEPCLQQRESPQRGMLAPFSQ